MSKFWLSERMVSRVFWEELKSSIFYEEASKDARKIAEITSPKVAEFPAEAGSISITSSIYLWLLSKYFSPKSVLEIGTYIGRSTLALAFGGKDSIREFYTCDGTFDCLDFNLLDLTGLESVKQNAVNRIQYFGKTMSTSLLQELKGKGVKLDLVFIDGRISNDDCKILSEVMSDTCVLVLDDFEGVEKGIVNAMMLRNNFRAMFLVSPAVEENRIAGNLALLLPAGLLTLTRQQGLPVNM
jgi:predicted O-methyltransferase YrrM